MQPFNQAKDAELLWQFLEDMLIHHTAFSHITKVLEQLFNTSGTLRNSVGVFITGLSRSGKTRCTQESESLHPPSRTAAGRIVPVLRVEVPSKPTVKGLTSEMLAAYGDPSAEKGTEQDKTRRLLIFIKECQTKMIIIDEIQHFVDKTDKFRIIHHLTDWLKILLNKSNIVIVIVGLPYAEALLNQNEQLRGRFIRTLHLPRFDWRDEQSRGEFLGLMDGFADLLCTKFTLPEIGSIDFAYRFYLASGGLTGYVFNILRQAAWIVIEDGRTNIEIEDINAAYLSVVSQIDQHVTSPFSRKFVLNDESALKKASSIGEGTDAFDSEIMHKRYKPKSFREARS